MSSPEEQLEMIREALKKPRESEETVKLNDPKGQYSNTVIGGGYTLNSSLGPNATPYYTVSGSNGANVTAGINWGAGTTTVANPWSISANTNMSGKLNLAGDEADIVVNGVSLMDILRDRLNVMIPNPKLEAEWAELKALGDQYRALEADIKEKAEIWRKLKEQS